MARLENFYYMTRDHQRVLMMKPKEEGTYSMGGICYGREGFDDGTAIATSTIDKNENGVATTRSGSKYELGSKHPDLLDMEKAIEKKIPVIVSWDLDWYANGDYRFEGYLENGQEVYGKVTSQDGNYIAINNVEFFVIWRNLKNWFTFQMFIDKRFPVADAWNEQCRPLLKK